MLMAYVLWGTNAIFIKVIDAPASTFVFTDGVLALLSMLPLLLLTGAYKELRSWKACGIAVAVGLLHMATNLTVFRAFQLTTVSNAILAHYMGPVLAFVLAPFFVRESRTRVFAFALALGVVGLAIMMPMQGISLENTHVVGIAFALISALFFAGYNIGVKRIAPQFSSVAMIFTTFAADVLGGIPGVLAEPEGLLVVSQLPEWFVLKALVTCTFPFFLFLFGIKRLEVQRVMILGYVEPVASIGLAAVLLAEIPGLMTMAGGVLILVAGAWIIVDSSVRKNQGNLLNTK